MAQRISRAKRTVSGVRFDQPGDVATVLRVLYLVFNEGYSGDVDLAAEAIRLTRQLATAIDHPEVSGLLALMLLHHARRAARTAPDGTPGAAGRAGPRPVGHLGDRRGRRDPAGRARPRPAGRVPGPGRDRGTARRRDLRRGDRLGAGRRVVRRAAAPDRQPGRPAQPGGGGRARPTGHGPAWPPSRRWTTRSPATPRWRRTSTSATATCRPRHGAMPRRRTTRPTSPSATT